MIVATYFGMFMPALRPPAKLNGDTRELQVRSRRAIDLDRLRERYLPNLGPTLSLPGTDYQFRAYCTKAEWGAALAAIAADIDYVKFKDTPAKYLKDDALTSAYSKMWGSIFNSFPTGSVYASGTIAPARSERTEWKRPSQLTEAEKLAAARQWDDMEPDPNDIALIEQDALTDHIRRNRGVSDAILGDIWSLSETQRRKQDVDDIFRSRAEYDIDRYTRGDHSKCTYASTKSARRACRRRNGK